MEDDPKLAPVVGIIVSFATGGGVGSASDATTSAAPTSDVVHVGAVSGSAAVFGSGEETVAVVKVGACEFDLPVRRNVVEQRCEEVAHVANIASCRVGAPKKLGLVAREQVTAVVVSTGTGTAATATGTATSTGKTVNGIGTVIATATTTATAVSDTDGHVDAGRWVVQRGFTVRCDVLHYCCRDGSLEQRQDFDIPVVCSQTDDRVCEGVALGLKENEYAG
jgi:hypothetical protein